MPPGMTPLITAEGLTMRSLLTRAQLDAAEARRTA